MKLSTFLLGGICGAAAYVYLSNKAKPMLFSAMSSNDSMGSMLGMEKQSKSKRSSSADSKAAAGSQSSAQNSAQSSKPDEGLGQVQEIINQDPALMAAVNEIMASSSSSKSEHRTH